MDLLALKDWWTGFVAGPEPLFYMRMACAGATLIYTALAWWEVVRPPERHRDEPRIQRVIWRVLTVVLAASASGLACYFLLAGVLERDRTGTPVRLVWANAAAAPFFWVLSLHAIKRRGDSWRRKALRGELQ